MRADSGPLKGLNPATTIVALVVTLGFAVFGGLAPDLASSVFVAASETVLHGFKWYYALLVTGCLLLLGWLLFSRVASLKLGDDDDEPAFGHFAWFSMVFGAGTGIGLVFWSIAEPMYHFDSNPFTGTTEASQAAETALWLTQFHWALHPWAIYVVVGLSLAFFAHRLKLPLAFRSVVYPLIGVRIHGPIGLAVDVLVVLVTVFAVATSLGLGAVQLNIGLSDLVGLPVSTTSQLVLIGLITVVATVSVMSGIARGIRLLSVLTLLLTFALIALLLVFGPTLFLLESFVQGLGTYVRQVIPQSLWTSAYSDAGRTWQADWTAFYWAWWIVWAPFVGLFMARISRGRTIRAFILGGLLVPALLTMVWLTVLGGTALHLEMTGTARILEAVGQGETVALYRTLEAIGAGVIGVALTVLATALIAGYFITSSDSATLVVVTLLSDGDHEPPRMHRAVWGVGEGAIAAVLLLSGGLGALQAGSVVAALPLSIIMLVMCYGLVGGLLAEGRLLREAGRLRR